jgi:hypothetical protein
LAVVDPRPAGGFPPSDPFEDRNIVDGMLMLTSNVACNFIIGAGVGKFENTPSKPTAEVNSKIKRILDNYRFKMTLLIQKAGVEPLLPTWIPKTRSGDLADTNFRQHVKQLAIPNVLGAPSLLLHDLGSAESVMDKTQADLVPNVFSLHHHMCVYTFDSSTLANLNAVESF